MREHASTRARQVRKHVSRRARQAHQNVKHVSTQNISAHKYAKYAIQQTPHALVRKVLPQLISVLGSFNSMIDILYLNGLYQSIPYSLHEKCPYFPTFALNMERYRVTLLIQSEFEKIRTRKTSTTDTFRALISLVESQLISLFLLMFPFHLHLLKQQKTKGRKHNNYSQYLQIMPFYSMKSWSFFTKSTIRSKV